MTHASLLKQLSFRVALGLVIAAMPVRVIPDPQGDLVVAAIYALAESGSGKDGDGGGSDNSGRGGDDDDNSGSDDDDDGDDGDDHDGGGDDDNSGRGSDDSGKKSKVSNTSERSGDNIHLRYSNGWQEWVRDRRYVLKDPLGRTVANRAATRKDLARMRAIAGR